MSTTGPLNLVMPRKVRSASTANRQRLAWIVALVIAVLLLWADAALACPSCKNGLMEGDEQSQRVISGYFWSILFMMSMPFAILLGISGLLYREVRKARRESSPDR